MVLKVDTKNNPVHHSYLDDWASEKEQANSMKKIDMLFLNFVLFIVIHCNGEQPTLLDTKIIKNVHNKGYFGAFQQSLTSLSYITSSKKSKPGIATIEIFI